MTVNLKAIHLVNEGSYLVNRGYHNLEVDGIPVDANTFVVSAISRIRNIRTFPGEILHYQNGQEEIKSVDTYQSEKNGLLVNATEDQEYSGCYSFSDLDEEFAYKRFLKTWTPVYSEARVEAEPVTVELTEVRVVSGAPDIKSLWNAPNMNAKAHLYSLDRNKVAVQIFKGLCQNAGLSYTLPTHSGARYAQVEGKYLFDDNMNFGTYNFVGTLEQCKQEKERIINHMNTRINLFIAKKNGASLKSAGDVLENLVTIQNLMCSLIPVKTSRTTYNSVLKSVQELVESVQLEVLNGGG